MTAKATEVWTVYGIRHHGPGCAQSLLKVLDAQQPDLILVEAPAEMDTLYADAAHSDLKPPVAALIYQTDAPKVASFYPFAKFSPEWQLLLWANKRNCTIRSMDLPASHSFALDEPKETAENHSEPTLDPLVDPFTYFAIADGYSDGERWWNDNFEERKDSASFFEAIAEAVIALRNELARVETTQTLQREAWMRRQMRAAKKEGFTNIAVVCGAWHVPALLAMPKVSDDNQLLKGLPKVRVSATWSPWTYERLTAASGYGAGVRSPGWYDHLWSRKKQPFITWMIKAARVFRRHDLEGSSASIIEATRLSASLAGMRGRPQPGLDESLEAMCAVFCGGDSMKLAFLKEPLLVGKKIGEVPDGISNLPLQRDIEANQRSLRLKPAAAVKQLVLDLREDMGIRKSNFLHRLLLLKINFAKKARSQTKGTFKETWNLEWSPEVVLQIVDASRFGNTLLSASNEALLENISNAGVEDITERLDLAILADLPDVAAELVKHLDNSAATTNDVLGLMQAVTALVRIVRYGDVRKTDSTHLLEVLLQITVRIHIALPMSSVGLSDEAASEFVIALRQYASSLNTLQEESTTLDFHQSVRQIAENDMCCREPAGYATRILYEAKVFDRDQTGKLFSYALSGGNEPAQSAAWIEGFLSGNGSLLMYETQLLAMIDQWLMLLSEDSFLKILPLLRRTFGQFTIPQRSQVSQAVFSNTLSANVDTVDDESSVQFDIGRAMPAVASVARMFNLTEPEY